MITLSPGCLCDVCAEEYGPHNLPHSIPCGELDVLSSLSTKILITHRHTPQAMYSASTAATTSSRKPQHVLLPFVLSAASSLRATPFVSSGSTMGVVGRLRCARPSIPLWRPRTSTLARTTSSSSTLAPSRPVLRPEGSSPRWPRLPRRSVQWRR